MITSVTLQHNGTTVQIEGNKSMRDLNRILQLVAAAYSDDPGTSDLDDEQPVSAITGLTLGDVRLARRLTQ